MRSIDRYMMREIPDRPWLPKAACRGMDVSLFVPDLGDTRAAVHAKRVCRGCPVRTECLEYALKYETDAHYGYGIWGGMSWRERRAERQRRYREFEHGTPEAYNAGCGCWTCKHAS